MDSQADSPSLAARRDPVAWFSRLTLLPVAALFLFGAIQFPSAPYHAQDGRYADKHGETVTASAYRSFRIWEPALFGAFAVWAPLNGWAALRAWKRRNRRLKEESVSGFARSDS